MKVVPEFGECEELTAWDDRREKGRLLEDYVLLF